MTHGEDTNSRTAFGTADRLVCQKCGQGMYIVRRSPDNILGPEYEKHIFECMNCGDQISRLIDRNGVEV